MLGGRLLTKRYRIMKRSNIIYVIGVWISSSGRRARDGGGPDKM